MAPMDSSTASLLSTAPWFHVRASISLFLKPCSFPGSALEVLLALEGLPQHPRSIPLLPARPRTAPAIPNLPAIPSIQERHSLGAHEEQGGTESVFGHTAGHKAMDPGKGLEPENGTDAPVFTGQSTISLSSCCQA